MGESIKMRNYTMFNYNFLFCDHFAKISNQAKLYYVALNFYANNGFVANPMMVLDSLGYDKGVFQELVNNGELLTLPDRAEVFIASYFIHNKGMKPYSWKSTPYAVYWENKLYIKKNGVATFTPNQVEEEKDFNSQIDFIDDTEAEEEPTPTLDESDDVVLERMFS